jgi:stage V sporulation protein G
LYADIAHPINSYCREMIQDYVINEYFEEIERAKQPGYVSRYDDFEFEFSEAPRTRPARFDQSHSGPSESHVEEKRSTPNDSASSKPHFRPRPNADGAGGSSPRPAGGEAFGAGIFPE